MQAVSYFITVLTDTSLVPAYKGTGLPSPGGISLVSAGLRSFAALAVVLAIMFLFVWALRKFRKPSLFGWKDGPIKVIGRSALNSKQSIYLVEVPDHLLVLGVSGEAITVLSEIRDRSTIEAVKSRNKGFSYHLSSSMRDAVTTLKQAQGKLEQPVNKVFSEPIESKVVGKSNSGLWEF